MSYLRVALPLLVATAGCATTTCRSASSIPGSTEVRAQVVAPLVLDAADEFDVPSDLLMAVIWVESRFKPEAVSSAGARGLMQLMPGTADDMAKRLGADEADPHDPEFAVRAGAAYLALLQRRFGGSLDRALAAYAMGPGKIRKALRETGNVPAAGRRYVRKVLAARRRWARLGST